MKTILYQNFYIDPHVERQKEIEACLVENILCDFIDEIVLLCDDKTREAIPETLKSSKVTFLSWATRPTYNDFLMLFKEEPALHILANTDIYFNETLKVLKERGLHKKEVFALSRYDKTLEGGLAPHLCRGSQDVWIFSAPPKNIKGANFTLGVPGCDNKFAFMLRRDGFKVTNPSKDIKCIHLHNTGIRNYVKEKDRLPPPYFLVYPINLAEATYP